MAVDYVVYYRSTARTRQLYVGKLVDNGAKKVNFTVERDVLGNLKKGDRIKVKVRDMHMLTQRINKPDQLQQVLEMDGEKLLELMRRIHFKATQRKAEALLQMVEGK